MLQAASQLQQPMEKSTNINKDALCIQGLCSKSEGQIYLLNADLSVWSCEMKNVSNHQPEKMIFTREDYTQIGVSI